VALITSANLTDSAMILNMEVGVLIHGGQLPQTLQALFRRLLTEAVIVPID
jgi:phosphatidylserine/phosphatidylglycerophosphate/cardiolipin synthase-like enzyme